MLLKSVFCSNSMKNLYFLYNLPIKYLSANITKNLTKTNTPVTRFKFYALSSFMGQSAENVKNFEVQMGFQWKTRFFEKNSYFEDS